MSGLDAGAESKYRPNGFCARISRNLPQWKALLGGSLIFISGGMYIARSIGFSQIDYILMGMQMRIGWFIGALIGTVSSLVLVRLLSKKLVTEIASICVIIGGIILTATRKNASALIAARYLDGIGVGLAFAPTLRLAGELCAANVRGTFAASIEQMSFGFGILLQMLYGNLWSDESEVTSFTVDQFQGVLSIICGLGALLLSAFCLFESPVTLLQQGAEHSAVDVLRRLQQPKVATQETYKRLEELKYYLLINRLESGCTGFRALLSLCFFRALNAMSISRIINFGLMVSSYIGTNININESPMWPYPVFAALRWLGILLSVVLIDTVGRNKLTVLGFLISSAFAFGVAVTFWKYYSGAELTSDMTTALSLLLIYQFFAGIAGTVSSAYLSEAFPLAVKDYYLTFAFILEMLIHLVLSLINLYPDVFRDYMYALGGLSLAFCTLEVWCLPETKRTTLSEAQKKFKGFFSTAF